LISLSIIVLGNRHVAFQYLALGCIFPRREAHRRLRGISALRDEFSSRLPGHGPMQFVLHCLEKRLGKLRLFVIVDAALFVDVGDLQIKSPLARPNLADAIEQFLEVIFAKPLIKLQPLIIQDKAFDDELPQRSRSPNAKLGRLRTVDAIADGDDGVEVVELDFASNLTFSFGLNSKRASGKIAGLG